MSDRGAAEQGELRRIAEVYTARDARADTTGAISDLANAAFVQQVELRLLRALRRAGTQLGQCDVLDVGCGSGYYLNRLSEFGARRTVGIDLMAERVALGKRRYPLLDLRSGSATDLPFSDGEFDIATQFTCLSSVLDPVVRARVAAEMWRVVRPGGLIVSFDMRPAPAVLRFARRKRGSEPAGAIIRPLGRHEVGLLFPGHLVVAEYPALHPSIIEFVKVRPTAVALLSTLPFLRSHLLAVIRRS